MLPDDQFEALRARLEAMYHEKVLPRRIRAIRTNSAFRWQPPLDIEIDRFCPHLTPDGPPEKIVAIFESRSFLVCTPEHGVEGRPHIFTRHDVKEVTDDSR